MDTATEILKDAAPYGGGVALAALAIAFGARVYLAQVKARLETIKSAPESARADLVGSETASLGLTADGLDPAQRFLLVQQVLNQRSERTRLIFLLAMVVSLALAGLALASILLPPKAVASAATLGPSSSTTIPSAPTQTATASPSPAAAIESIPFDPASVTGAFNKPTCLLSGVGLYPYCVDGTVVQCSSDVANAGGPFALNHKCVERPSAVYCGAYRSDGAVYPICFASQNQCESGRHIYKHTPKVAAVSDSCREIDLPAATKAIASHTAPPGATPVAETAPASAAAPIVGRWEWGVKDGVVEQWTTIRANGTVSSTNNTTGFWTLIDPAKSVYQIKWDKYAWLNRVQLSPDGNQLLEEVDGRTYVRRRSTN